MEHKQSQILAKHDAKYSTKGINGERDDLATQQHFHKEHTSQEIGKGRASSFATNPEC